MYLNHGKFPIDTVRCKAGFVSSSESVNLNVYAQYTCTVSHGSIFLKWSVTGIGPEKIFLFSTSDAVGSTLLTDGFFATVTNTTNGLTSILSFYVTKEHNGTQIICEEPVDQDTDITFVRIRGREIL